MKKIAAKGLLLTGIIAIILAIVCWHKGNNVDDYLHMGRAISPETYGGDAYTGMQNAAAQAATNLYFLNGNLAYVMEGMYDCIGYVLFTIGLIVFFVGVWKMGQCEATLSVTTTNNSAQTVKSSSARIAYPPKMTHSNTKKCYLCGRAVSQYDMNCPYCGEKLN